MGVHNRICLAILAAVMAFAANSAATAAPSEIQAIRDRTLMTWRQTTEKMPMLDGDHPSRTMHQVVSLAIENGNLVLRTSLPSTPAPTPDSDGRCRLKIDDWPEWASVRIAGGAATGQELAIPRTFELARIYVGPDHTESMAARRSGNQTVLSRNIYDSRIILGASLTQQDKDDDFTHPHPCSMTLYGLKQEVTGPITISEDDFAMLVHKHPDETRCYLRPLFHRFNADFVFAIEPRIGWQVFSDATAPDPKAADAVNKLLPLLADGTFRQRNDARKALEALGISGALAILRLDRIKLTAEQNAELDAVVAPYRQLNDAQVKALRTDPLFLLDCLYCSDPIIRKAAIEQLRKTTQLDLQFDPAADDSARDAAVAAVREKLVAGKFLPAL
jgi:hypothetical protein